MNSIEWSEADDRYYSGVSERMAETKTNEKVESESKDFRQ